MPVYTKVKVGRKSYTVVSDAQGLIRISATHAVHGNVNIDTTGRLAKQVLAAMETAKAKTDQ